MASLCFIFKRLTFLFPVCIHFLCVPFRHLWFKEDFLILILNRISVIRAYVAPRNRTTLPSSWRNSLFRRTMILRKIHAHYLTSKPTQPADPDGLESHVQCRLRVLFADSIESCQPAASDFESPVLTVSYISCACRLHRSTEWEPANGLEAKSMHFELLLDRPSRCVQLLRIFNILPWLLIPNRG